tara:strand:- start:181 stop:831 length:651 start_codon:yes stop_codon:yes gene_type:complete
MDYKTNRARPVLLALAMLVVLGASLVSAQEGGGERGWGIAGLFFALCLGPLVLWGIFWTIFGITYMLAYPPLLLYGAVYSGANISKRMDLIFEREKATISHYGKDPLSTLKGAQLVGGIQDSGLVYSSVVYSPSHWQLLIGWFNNLFGGSINVLHDVVAVARAEAKQRLRDRAMEAGWDEVLNVRIDTSMMAPAGRNAFVKGAVEVFAYGTGVKLS